MLFAGLESIAEVIDTDEVSELKQEIEQLKLENVIQDDIFVIDQLANALDNLSLVKTNIEQYGVTPAIEALAGSIDLSTEGLKDKLKAGYEKVKKFILDLIDKIIKFFSNPVKKLKKQVKVLEKLIQEKKGKVDWESSKNITTISDRDKLAKAAIDILSSMTTDGDVQDHTRIVYDSGIIDFDSTLLVINEISMKNTPGVVLSLSKLSKSGVDLENYLFNYYERIINKVNLYIDFYTNVDLWKKKIKSSTNNDEIKQLQFKVLLFQKLLTLLTKYYMIILPSIVKTLKALKLVSNNNLQKAIDDKDLLQGYAVITTLIGKDRWTPYYESPALAEYADIEFKKKGITFFVPDDGDTEFPSKDKWDEDLRISMITELNHNFSRKKFDFIIEIMTYLRETGHPGFQAVDK